MDPDRPMVPGSGEKPPFYSSFADPTNQDSANIVQHTDSTSTSGDKRKFACKFEGCSKSFNRRDYLERHAANHLAVKPFLCKPCNRHFARSDLYENHLSTKFHKKRAAGVPDVKPTSQSVSAVQKPRKQFIYPNPPGLVQQPLGIGELQPQYSSPGLYSSSVSSSDIPSYASVTGEASTYPISRGAGNLFGGSPHPLRPPQSGAANHYQSAFPPIQGLPPPPLAPSAPGASTQGLQPQNSLPINHAYQPSPQVSSIPSNYAWLFDDSSFDSTANVRCDQVYSSILHQSEENAKALNITVPNSTNATAAAAALALIDPTILSYSRAQEITRVILPPESLLNPASFGVSLDATSLGYYIDQVWSTVQPIHFFIHRSAFDPETQNVQLLGIMVILGMALTNDVNIRKFASLGYMNVVLSLKHVLMSKPLLEFEDDLGLLQAFCLLMRYERHINPPNNNWNDNDTQNNNDNINNGMNTSAPNNDNDRESQPSYSLIGSKWLIGRFMWLLIPRASQYDNGDFPQPFRYGKVVKDGYVFYEGVDPYLAWIEWTRFEACKRATHFALYCDCVHMLNDANIAPMQLSIFDVDTHMPAPEVMWNISNQYDFFRVVGLGRILRNVPYLYLIKSMLRLPQHDGLADSDEYASTWSIFALTTTLYGLLSVARAMTGSATTAEDVIRKLNTAGSNGVWNVEFFDKNIQTRLSCGFDLWNKYFEASSGLDKSHYPFASPPQRNTSLNSNSKSYNIHNANSATGSTSSGGSSPEYSGSSANKLENASLMGQLQVRPNSDLFVDYVLLILLHNHSAQILMSGDLRIILSVANGMPFWVTMRAPENVLDHIDLPVYRRWTRSGDANSMVSTACLFLVRAIAGHRLLTRDRAENLLLGLVTFYAVLIIWLHSLVLPRYGGAQGIDIIAIDDDVYIDARTKKPNVKKIVKDATRYLHYVWDNTRSGSRNSEGVMCAEYVGHAESEHSSSRQNDSNSGLGGGGYLPSSTSSSPLHVISSRSVIALGSWLLADVYVDQFKTGGQTLFELYQRVYLGIPYDKLFNVTG